MNELALTTSAATPRAVVPRIPIDVRVATIADLPFIDALQKKHAKQVGWMPTKQLEGKIDAGQVLIAQSTGGTPVSQAHLGYCIGQDQYFKRDDCGIIYQLNVAPTNHRSLIGATLIKAMFDRAAYGCKLFCCWCAQDIEANYFWDVLGFVPLAFRAGSREKSRVHIFWQRRIRAGDTTTPYWFPSQTTGGSIREDRLVFPIPPGLHWRDEMPRVLPNAPAADRAMRQLPASGMGTRRGKALPNPEDGPVTPTALRRQFRPPSSSPPPALPPAAPKPAPSAPALVKKPKLKNDPKLVAATRELRDRWLEQVNASGEALSAQQGQGKYDVSRQLPAALVKPTPLLGAA